MRSVVTYKRRDRLLEEVHHK